VPIKQQYGVKGRQQSNSKIFLQSQFADNNERFGEGCIVACFFDLDVLKLDPDIFKFNLVRLAAAVPFFTSSFLELVIGS